jgi:hypothetical protein
MHRGSHRTAGHGGITSVTLAQLLRASDSPAGPGPPAEHHFHPACFAGPRGAGEEIVIEADDRDAAFARAHDAALTHGGRVGPLAARPWG